MTALHLDISEISVDVRLFHEAGCRLVHKYRVYKDPFPHPALRGVVINLSSDQILVDHPNIQIHDPVCPDIPEEGDMDISIAVLRPPPGFLQFSWLLEEWGPGGDPSLFDFSKKLPSWFPWGYRGQSVDPPSLPISPIHDSLDDSVVANVGSSRDESNTPSEAHNFPKDCCGGYSV